MSKGIFEHRVYLPSYRSHLPAHPSLRDARIEEERHTVVKQIMATLTPNNRLKSKTLLYLSEHRESLVLPVSSWHGACPEM